MINKPIKFLIAIVSCTRDQSRGYHSLIRGTWLSNFEKLKNSPGIELDYFFFMGKGSKTLKPDEVVLEDAPDDYNGLPVKMNKVFNWVAKHGYDYMAKIDCDTYFRLDKFLAESDFRDWDWIGTSNHPDDMANIRAAYPDYGGGIPPWMSGSCYFMSKRAVQYMVDNPPDGKRDICPALGIPCEDLFAGAVLTPLFAEGKIKAKHEPRIGYSFRKDFKTEFSSHFCSENQKRVMPHTWMVAHHRKAMEESK